MCAGLGRLVRRFRQVVYNILSNAVKFTPDHGSVEVRVLNDDQDNPEEVIVAVKDTGQLGSTLPSSITDRRLTLHNQHTRTRTHTRHTHTRHTHDTTRQGLESRRSTLSYSLPYHLHHRSRPSTTRWTNLFLSFSLFPVCSCSRSRSWTRRSVAGLAALASVSPSADGCAMPWAARSSARAGPGAAPPSRSPPPFCLFFVFAAALTSTP
jgi:hypothetical protein